MGTHLPFDSRNQITINVINTSLSSRDESSNTETTEDVTEQDEASSSNIEDFESLEGITDEVLFDITFNWFAN